MNVKESIKKKYVFMDVMINRDIEKILNSSKSQIKSSHDKSSIVKA